MIYVVNQDTGLYRSIQSAINAAEPGSVIKIDPGLYQENLIITKHNLRFILKID
jgi:pectin methylesterase-like acyl-CoA thioesterase